MIFGVPKEIRDLETRVGLTPAGVQTLVQAQHTVYVGHEAGLAAGYSDEDYRQAGAQIVYTSAEVYGRADVICKIARPTAQEHHLFKEGQAICAFLSLTVASSDFYDILVEKNITAIAYEMIVEADGTRPVLLPASEIAGRLAPFIAGNLLMTEFGRGVLLGGIPGIPPSVVVILGGGVLGGSAARAFVGVGADVIVLDRNVKKLRSLERELGGRIKTMFASEYNLSYVSKFADVLIGAVAVAGQKTPVLVSQEQVKAMRPGTIIMDYAIDEGGCVATSRPTTRRNPTYVYADVVHYCVPNMTSSVGRTTSQAMTNAILPYMLALGQVGLNVLTHLPPALRKGIALYQGRPAAPALATRPRPHNPDLDIADGA